MKYATVEEVVKDLERNPVEEGGHIYHPIPFSEFSHLKTSSNRNEIYKKWRLIKQSLIDIFPEGIANLNVMDVGANAGFYTFALAKAGAKVTAFEPHLRYGPIGEFLVKEKKFDIDWYNVQFEQKLVSQRQFDVVLMLSVFQWMADGGNTFREANECLRRISEMSRYMIFELGFNKGKSCIRTAKRNHYAALVQLLYNNTAYRNFMLLGKTRLWASYSRYLVLCSNDERYEDSIFRRIIRMIKV